MKRFILPLVALGLSLAFLGGCGPKEPGKQPEEQHVYAVSLAVKEYSLIVGDGELGSAAVVATATDNGNEVEGAEISFEIDTAVARYEDGALIAVGAGSTTLTAVYRGERAQAAVRVYDPASAEEINSFGEEFVALYGRTYQDGAGVHFDNPASGFEVSFVGTELSAELSADGTAIVRIYTDGNDGRLTRLKSGTAVLAGNLKEGLHTVRVLKASEVNVGGLAVKSLAAEKFVASPKRETLKIEFIGDSITAGAGNLASGGGITAETTDGTSSFATLTGRALGADFSVVAVGGICLNTAGQLGYSMAQMHTWTTQRHQTEWVYDEETDVVVLGLGTNDAVQAFDYIEKFGGYYQSFLLHLRTIYPKAQIVCVYGMMGCENSIDKRITQAVEELNDEKITYLKDFREDHSGGLGHPGTSAHREYAETLTAYIRGLLN